MLSIVLPLLVIAIALTPVIASASAVYEYEDDEQSNRLDTTHLETVELVNAEIRN